MTREQAKNAIEGLAKDFLERYEEFHTPEYKEFNLRQSFIVPFFNALGWDVENKDQISEAYREVISEDSLKIQGKTKAPDYGFRLQGSDKRRLFFVEAKKPNVSLKTNKEPSYQLRRYGRSAQVPISILTNFEEFVVYDCTKRPNQNDSASVARIKYINFKDYAKEFEFIYDTFSHEAVLKGRFSKFVQSDTHRKGTQTLDKDFVESLDKWRKYLAVSIALNNQKLNEEEINFVVQQTIDRLIFLRFCEDRGVETYGQLQAAASKGEGYKNLFDLFKQADDKYNSGLFDFEKDTLSAKLKIDNKVVKNIITELYYPDCEYDFRVMPVEVLGNAYEQFLGKVIRITASHSARIEEKPEVRKAGGVYYTPQYIVEYIVKNTIGKLIEGKSPKGIEKIKIVDPACGSGSFLIGAFEFLMRYHVKWYHDNGFLNKKIKDNPLHPNGALTTHEKKKILLNNIFGVDLDVNAVEVSKLSLLLKCMEGETEASIKQQLSVFHERVLPDLDNNIKSGNSLIDIDFYDSEIDLGLDRKIKPFNWRKGFSGVFKQGGFDVVIGNPPYGALIETATKKYFQEKYQITEGNYETYSFFIEKGTKILSSTGILGYIIPDTWFTTKSSTKLRKYILENISIDEVQMLNENIFRDAKVDVCTFLLTRKEKAEFDVLIYDKDAGQKEIENQIYVKKNSFTAKDIKNNPEYSFSFNIDKSEIKIIRKLNFFKNYIEDYCLVASGCKPYEEGKGNPPQTKKTLKEKPFTSEKKPNKTFRKLYRGEDIARYFANDKRKEWLSYGDWLAAPRNPEIFNNARLLFQAIRNPKLKQRLVGSFIDDDSVNNNSLTNIILKSDAPFNLKFLLGLLNSKLLNWFFLKSYVIVNIDPRYIKQIPLPFEVFSHIQREHDEIVKHVDLLLQLNCELAEEKLQSKIEQIKRRIDHSEEKIDKLIYDLYKLSENEIKLIDDIIKA
jgi:type I restriction-modification system DNA methylase subunit